MDRMYKMKMEDMRAMRYSKLAVVLHHVVVMATDHSSRKVCQPELDTTPQDTTSMPKLSSTNLLWKEVTEETAKV